MKRWALVMCALAACVSVPDYAPSNGISVTRAGDGGNVVGRNYALHFETSMGAHYPDSLTVNGTDLLGHNAAAGCSEADVAGFVMAPMGRVSAHGSLPITAYDWTVGMKGPAIAQIRILWSSRFDCAPMKTPAGLTIFTMYPDGRIVRHDELGDNATDPLSAASCACMGTGSSLSFNSYWTLDATQFTSITVPPSAPVGLPAPGNTISDVTTACLDGPAQHVAFGGDTMRVYQPTNATIAFDHSYTLLMPAQIADYNFKSASTIVLDTSCAAALVRVAETVAPPMLKINQLGILPSKIDGIYGGEGPDLSSSQTVTDDHVELQGELSGSFAVWLGFPHDVDALTVRKNGGQVAYIPQRVPGIANEWIVWFEQGLTRTDTISIDAR